MQAGNSIGGAISQDGSLVAAQNYTPGGVKVFDAQSLALVADIPAEHAPRQDIARRRSRRSARPALHLLALRCRRDLDRRPVRARAAALDKLEGIGRQPYDALVTPDGRHYIAGLFGEDGLALVDLWHEPQRAPHPRRLRPWRGAAAGLQDAAPARLGGRRPPRLLPAIGRHEVLVVDTRELGRRSAASPSPASRCS